MESEEPRPKQTFVPGRAPDPRLAEDVLPPTDVDAENRWLQPVIDRLRKVPMSPALGEIITELQKIERHSHYSFDTAAIKEQRDQAMEERNTLSKRFQAITDKNAQLQAMVDAAVKGTAPAASEDHSTDLKALEDLNEKQERLLDDLRTENKRLKQDVMRWDSACVLGMKIQTQPGFPLFVGINDTDLAESCGNVLVDCLTSLAQEILRLRTNVQSEKNKSIRDDLAAQNAQGKWDKAVMIAHEWVGDGAPLDELLPTSLDLVCDGLNAMGKEVLRLRMDQQSALREAIAGNQARQFGLEDKIQECEKLREELASLTRHNIGAPDPDVTRAVSILEPPKTAADALNSLPTLDPLRRELWYEAAQLISGVSKNSDYDPRIGGLIIESLRFRASLLPEKPK